MAVYALPRLLVFELRLLGDAVMSLPFIRAAQARFDVHVCCSPAAEPVFRMVLGAAQVHVWRPPWLASEVTRTAPFASWQAIRKKGQELAALGITHAVCAWCDPRTGLLMGLCGAGVRVGFPSHRANFYGLQLPWRRRQLLVARAIEALAGLVLRRPLLTCGLRRRDTAQHHVEDWRQIADVLGLELPDEPPLRDVDPFGAMDSQPLTAGLARTTERPRIIIHPGASEVHKRWPLPYFLRLADALSAHYDVRFIEPPEVTLGDAVRERHAVIAASSLFELATSLRECDVYIGNDAGIGHLADALGKPVIAIFLASEPAHFAPWHSRQYVIAVDGSCDTRPCFGRCLKPTVQCHAPLGYEAVWRRIEPLLTRLFA